MSIMKKIKESNSHQIKPKQSNLPYSSLEKIRDVHSMRLVNRSTNNKEARSSKTRFYFLKTIYFTVIDVIRYQLKSLKCSYLQRKQLRQ